MKIGVWVYTDPNSTVSARMFLEKLQFGVLNGSFGWGKEICTGVAPKITLFATFYVEFHRYVPWLARLGKKKLILLPQGLASSSPGSLF